MAPEVAPTPEVVPTPEVAPGATPLAAAPAAPAGQAGALGAPGTSVAVSGRGPTDAEVLWGVVSPGESRWPSLLAVLATLALYLVLPPRLSFGPRLLLPSLEAALAVPIMVVNPTKLTPESRNMRWLSVVLTVLIAGFNSYSLVRLAGFLLNSGHAAGRTLIYAAVLIWLTNVAVFALWYWELDRGGPRARCSPDHRRPDFLFPQMATPGVAERSWVPKFLDYLYVSFTNSTAFSPTDTMPLTVEAKMLMGVQSLVSLVTVALVAARAVNILS